MDGDFRTLLKRYCLQSSVLGLKYFYLYPDWVSRCFWSVTMVLVFGLAVQIALLLYDRFEQMPTRITIENQYEPVHALPYPAITICSPNQVTISGMRHFNRTLVNGAEQVGALDLVKVLQGFQLTFTNSNKEELALLQLLIEKNRYTIVEVLSLLPQSCDEFLRLCAFKMVTYDRCRGLFQPILTAYGLCCTFNSVYYLKDGQRNEEWAAHKLHLVENEGLPSALSVVADYQPEDACDGSVNNGGALRVMFTDWNEFPADDMTTLVLTDAETFHSLHATVTYCSHEVLQLPADSRKCYLPHEKKLRFFKEYHNVECDHVCRAAGVERACGCLLPHLPALQPELTCNITSLPCIMQVNTHMDTWLSGEECECPRDCESRAYSVDLSQGNFLALPYVLNPLYTTYPLNKSSAVMHFFFPTSVYVKQKQETVMSLISLASNLGGVFGLCVGCSVISVVELLFFLYRMVRNRLTPAPERRDY